MTSVPCGGSPAVPAARRKARSSGAVCDHPVVDKRGNGAEGEEEPAIFGWVSLAAVGGIVLGAVNRHVLGGHSWVGLVALVLLGGATVAAFANGWVWGMPPRETRGQVNDRIARGLVGTSIATRDGVVVVVDDPVSGGDRKRRSVKAVDEAGRLGLLFVELDRSGRVVAAALPGGQWAAAEAVR